MAEGGGHRPDRRRPAVDDGAVAVQQDEAQRGGGADRRPCAVTVAPPPMAGASAEAYLCRHDHRPSDPDPDRGQPRHRARHRRLLHGPGLAHHHLLARGRAARVPAQHHLERPYRGRLADPAGQASFIAETLAILGDRPVHALVNNAGVSPKTPYKERLGCLNGPIDGWRAVFELNFFAPLVLSRGFAAALHRGQGRSSTSPRSPGTPPTRSPGPPIRPPRRPCPG